MKLLESTKVNDVCDERYGWFPANVEEDCRKILNAHMAKAFDGKSQVRTSLAE